ncbi:Uncharacterized protein Fot_19692 [Forsythia ovata]|uniref:Uncharacterized protein n=1 Tax=Forsythia ovata TaxID=205694 RepID=A0ABD1VLR2_9LAMI
MSSEHNDSKNQPAAEINPEIMGEVSHSSSSFSSSEGREEVDQGPSAMSTSRRDKNPNALSKMKVVDERGTLLLRLLVLSMAPNSVPTVPPIVEAVGSISSSLPILSTASVPVAIVLPVMEEVGDASSPSPPVTSTSLLVDVQHQDKGNEVVIDEGEKVAPKRSLEEEGATIDFGRVKRKSNGSPLRNFRIGSQILLLQV